ncbi:MAG: tRNA isopentenyl-2-thiomethyl-A-37 hydroxylase MiaE [Bryobacteraceae bacterium]
MPLRSRTPLDWGHSALSDPIRLLTGIAKDEASHLSQVTRLLIRRGGQMDRGHQSAYARALRALVRKGGEGELLDRLMVSALIEARSCERFGILAATSPDEELAAFYNALFSSELGHYKAFLRLANKVADKVVVEARWGQMLDHEARIVSEQPPGPRIHSGVA